jgi:uncharacterized protein YjiS (DUF1127 family)
MTDLRSLPSDLAPFFPSSSHLPSRRADRRSAAPVVVGALGFTPAALRFWRQATETYRARRHLLQLDDHLLRDIGLTRADVAFGDFEMLGRHRRAGGFR